MKLTWRRRLGVYAGLGAVSVAALSLGTGGTAYADQTISTTFPQVTCSALVGGSTLIQKQDITVGFIVPDSVAPNEEFTITWPGGSAPLPASSNGLTISNYTNLSTTYQVQGGASFVDGSVVNPGSATIDPINPNLPTTTTPYTSEIVPPDKYKGGTPGPFPPGTLTTPTVTAKIKAPASGAVTINAFQLTTTASLQGGALTAQVTCAIPTTTLATIPVVEGPATTVTTPTTQPTTTTTAGTPTTPPTTDPGNTTTTGPTTPTTTPPPTTVPPPTTTVPPPTTVATTVPPPTTVATTVPPTTAGPTTTVTAAPTTTVPVTQEQTKIHAKYTNTNICTSEIILDSTGTPLDLNGEEPNESSTVTATLETDLFPSPHEGDQIKLTNGTLKIAVPASLIQQGFDFGILTDGDLIPSTVKFEMDATAASPSSKTYSISQDAKVVIKNGIAQPLSATVKLPDSTWTPDNDQDAVIFTQKSLTVIAKINALGGLTATFSCTPQGNNTVAVLQAFAGQEVSTTTLPGTVTTQATTDTTTAPAATGDGTLPRTGASVALWLVIGAILLDLGIVALIGTRRRTKAYLQR